MVPKVTESYKEEKRKALLTSALHCFAERGFQETTIDDIVQHAGVSKGMLYTYFPSKEDIYLQLMEDKTEESLNQVRSLFAHVPTATEKLRLLMDRFRDIPFQDAQRKFNAVHLEFWMYATRHEDIREVLLKRADVHLELVTDIIREGVRSGEFPQTVDVDGIASLFWAMRDGISLHFLNRGGAEEYKHACQMAETLMFRYLGVE